MRRSIILSLVCLISLGVFAQKQKIGHVNTQQIMQSLFVKDSIQTKYMAFQTMLQGELQKIQTDLVTREQELAQKQATMEKSLFDIQAQALMRDKQEFQEVTYPTMQQSLQNKMAELQVPVEKKITEAIEKVAKANGFTYILQLEATLYAGGEDITKLVRKELGLSEEPEELPAGAGMPGAGLPAGY